MKRINFGRKAVAVLLVAALCFTGCSKNQPENDTVILSGATTDEDNTTTADKSTEETHTEPTAQTESDSTGESTTDVQETTESGSSSGISEPDTQTQTETYTEPTTPEQTTPEQTTTEQAELKAWDLINNETLNPTDSGYEELDNLIEGYITMLYNEGTLTEGMSQYQIVHSIYVWFIKKITYNRGMNVDAGKYSSSDPATTPEEVLWATDLFNTYQGCCYNYSSAFMYIMRHLGYDAHLLSGQVSSYNGGTTPHCWLYVNLGGVAYTFDPDVDMNYYWRNLNSGSTEEKTDTLFCRKMDEMGYFYTIEKYHTN